MATSKTKAARASSKADESVLVRYPDGAEYVVPSAAIAADLHPEAEVVGPEHPPETAPAPVDAAPAEASKEG